MIEFTWYDVDEVRKNIVSKIGCRKHNASALEGGAEPTLKPRSDLPSTIVCKIKVSKGDANDNCSAVDNSPCPEGYSTNRLYNLRVKQKQNS